MNLSYVSCSKWGQMIGYTGSEGPYERWQVEIIYVGKKGYQTESSDIFENIFY